MRQMKIFAHRTHFLASWAQTPYLVLHIRSKGKTSRFLFYWPRFISLPPSPPRPQYFPESCRGKLFHLYLRYTLVMWDFPGGSDGKVSVYNAGDLGSNPWVWKFPGEGKGYPLQYSCLENPMDGGAWSSWGRKESDMTERLHMSDVKACFIFLSIWGQQTFSASFKTVSWQSESHKKKKRSQLVRIRSRGDTSQRQICCQNPKPESKGALRFRLKLESGFGNAGDQLGQMTTEKTVSHL